MSLQVSSGAKCELAALAGEVWTRAEHLQPTAKLQNHSLFLNSELADFGREYC